MSKDKLIPELRFPEFKNEGGWMSKELGQISEIVRGGSPRPIQDYLTNRVDGINWLKIADVTSDSKYITGTKEKVLKEALSSTREVSPGDLILSNSMSFGRPYILKIKTCIHDGWIAIRKISYVTFEDYLYYFISSESSQTYFNINAAGAAVKNLNAEIIKLLPIHFPNNKSEQQKIASCLSSLDEVIAAHSQKLDLLKDHKKGLMQNLFPTNSITNDQLRITNEKSITNYESSITSEDDQFANSITNDQLRITNNEETRNSQFVIRNLPKYRFKEFEKDGEWVEKKLGDVATFLKGKGISKADVLENGALPCIRYGELYTYYNETISEIKSYTNLNAEDLVLSEPNDVIIPASGETQIDIATASCVVNSGIALGGDLNIIRSEMNGVFLSYYLNNAKKREIAQMAQGISVVHLYPSQLQTLSITIPKYEEQQKIASCLSSLDAIITAQADKIAQLALHKKGLMQGLFPKPITNYESSITNRKDDKFVIRN